MSLEIIMNYALEIAKGETGSAIVGVALDVIRDVAKQYELDMLLKEYHERFCKQQDTEISSYNVDMKLMENKRDELIDCFKQIYQNKNFNIDTNKRNQLNKNASMIVVGSDNLKEIQKQYLNGFFKIVEVKLTEDISSSVRIVNNIMCDQVNDGFKDQNKEIFQIKQTVKSMANQKTDSVDFSSYYETVFEEFTVPKNDKSAYPVGNESDDDAYIDTFIELDSKRIQVRKYLEKWFHSMNHGVILLYGEPGHGKTMLCKKAMVEFKRGTFLNENAQNVLWVNLNTGYNPNIFKDGDMILRNALVWGADKQHSYSFEDCKNSILFMDGFDELIDVARKNIEGFDIVSFIKRVDNIAKENHIHIVVLSRTTAVQGNLKEDIISERSFRLLPLTEKQQDDWFRKHTSYNIYKDTFETIRKDENMQKLLGIPLLFRMIVHSRFDKISPNIIELYDTLFMHLMTKRGTIAKNLNVSMERLTNLAYDIYCNDTYSAVIQNDILDNTWLFDFYLVFFYEEENNNHQTYKVSFFHRTFYQFFLAKYIYLKLLDLKDISAEVFIGSFAERELDRTVLDYLTLMLKKKDKVIIDSNLGIVFDTLVKTQAYNNLTPHFPDGDSEKSKIGRSTNIYRNVMHIAYALSYVIKTPIRDGLDIIIRTFPSYKIGICSDEKARKPDMTNSVLNGANLAKSNLSGINMYKVTLHRAHLGEANLNKSNFSEANLTFVSLYKAWLIESNISGATLIEVDLRNSNLRKAILTKSVICDALFIDAVLNGAKLIKTTLNYCNCIKADLSGADLREANLINVNLNSSILHKANLEKAEITNTNLERANLIEANLVGATIKNSNLRNTRMSRAILKDAFLKDIDLNGAYLNETDLTRAVLCGADMCGASLLEAHLSNADFTNADLSRTWLDENINYVKSLQNATIDIKYKNLIHPDIEGYDSIRWLDNKMIIDSATDK